MDTSFDLIILITLTLVAGISAQVIANFLRVPGIVFLLPFGILLGSDGLGLLHPQALGVGLDVLVSLAVALILFEGGLNLRLHELSHVSSSLRNLVTIGTGITLVGAAVAAHYLSEFPWSLAFLFGSLVVVTGPTVVNPILKRVRVENAVSTLLEGEGVLIDPVGAILAVVVLQVVLSGQADLIVAAEQMGERLIIGAAIGAVGGWLIGAFLLWSRQFLTEELRNSVVLAGAIGVFALGQFIVSESGLMAVVIAGMVVREKAAIAQRSVRQFHGQLVVLAISVLFILLTASLSIDAVVALGWGAVATVLVLMLVVRPLSVAICTAQSDLGWRQKLFVAWLAPRGIVAASVASLFALVLTERSITGGEALKALVFLTIAMTVMIQGLTATLAARWLRLDQGGCTVIVGDHPLARELALLLRCQNQSVELISLQSSSIEPTLAEALNLAPKQAAPEGLRDLNPNHHRSQSSSTPDPSSEHPTDVPSDPTDQPRSTQTEWVSLDSPSSLKTLSPEDPEMSEDPEGSEDLETPEAHADLEKLATHHHSPIEKKLEIESLETVWIEEHYANDDPVPDPPLDPEDQASPTMGSESEPLVPCAGSDLHITGTLPLDKSALIQADLEHADTLVVLTVNPEVSWAVAELAVKLFATATVWTVLLPDTPISEGIRVFPYPFEHLQRWAGYLETQAAELRSITLPTLIDLSFPWQTARAAVDPAPTSASPFSGLTLDCVQDQFSSQIAANYYLPLLLLRPRRIGWLGDQRPAKSYLFPQPEIWQPGDRLYYLERITADVTLPQRRTPEREGQVPAAQSS